MNATQATPAIEVRYLHKAYGSRTAVDEVSLTVSEAEIFGIIGPNGAGKTTTVECIAGLRRPDGGDVRVFGLDPHQDRTEVREILGVQLQESSMPDEITVKEALELYSSFYRDPANWRELVDMLSLNGKENVRYKALSGGQKQRLSIALALVGKPRVAILDELTTGLDPQARRETWELISKVRDSGVTVILVTHFMDEAEYLCDRIAVIDQGKVAAIDTPGGLIEQIHSTQHVRFRLREPIPESLLADLPDVTDVSVTGDHWVVSGRGQLLGTVASALAREGVTVDGLRVDQHSLEDAFVAFTNRTTDTRES